MNIIKPVEQATDSQLRALVRPYAGVLPSHLMQPLVSEYPMLTVERAQLISLLKHNHTFQFIA